MVLPPVVLRHPEPVLALSSMVASLVLKVPQPKEERDVMAFPALLLGLVPQPPGPMELPAVAEVVSHWRSA